MAPRIDSLSNHRLPYGEEIQRLFIYGDGFKDITAVMVGDTMVNQLWVDSETIMTIELPHLVAGATYWVQIQSLDGNSPCEGDAQLLTIDAISDTPAAGRITITGIVPEEIALGRREQYWLLGSGLSNVTLAVIGSTPCRIESYDEERCILTVPEEIEGAVDGGTLDLQVSSPSDLVHFAVVGRGGQAVAPPDGEGFWPGVTSVEPAEIPAAGGDLTIRGYRMAGVNVVTLGTVSCQVHGSGDDWVTATAPSLEAFVGERLAVVVATPDLASPDGSVSVLVLG